ncbi:MafI family immunity protein [Sorangium sp. So ce117]|uniref:MafI family immunity protein n=1 Tax=Sorangium sp. So ce117 TaxID=3133277 RepID=UPI003F617A6F
MAIYRDRRLVTKQEIQALCAVALESFKDVLPPERFRDAHDWVHRYGEWGLAMEHVIDWVGDLDLPVDQAQFDVIERAMAAMGWGESSRMKWLREYFASLRSGNSREGESA